MSLDRLTWPGSPGPSRPNSPPQPPNTPASLELSRSGRSSPEYPAQTEKDPNIEKLCPVISLDLVQKVVMSLQNELAESQGQIERDTDVINSLHEKINDMEELIQKQKVTISNQSKTISDRRNLRKNQVFPITPHHAHFQHQPSRHTHPQNHQHYPPNSAPGPAPGPSMAASPFETPQSTRSQQHAPSVYDQPPPKFELPFGLGPGASQAAFTPIVRDPPSLMRSTRDIFMPISAATISFSGGTDINKAIADFSSRFLNIMRQSELFGQMHANYPNIYKDSHLDDKVKEYLMGISNRTHASLLLGNFATRFCLVSKAVNFYLIREILTINVGKGFDTSVDLEIGQIRKQMAADTPPTVRHLMIMAMSTHLSTLTSKPGFAEFCQQKIQSHVEKLWQYIAPLSHDPSNQNGQACADLLSIISEAQSLALDMFLLPLEYKFDFPDLGEQFDPMTMINRDPYIQDDPQVLKNNDARVRLGISPTVRIRNNSESPGNVKLMYLGNVLLKHTRK